MKILVAGGAGYLGRLLCERLVTVGHTVYSVDRGVFGTPKTNSQRLVNVPVDIRLCDSMMGIMEGVDAVVNLASVNGDKAIEKDMWAAEEINISGAHTLARAAVKNGVQRVIQIIPIDVYGVTENGPVAEDEVPWPDPIKGRNYTVLSRDAESVLDDFWENSGKAVSELTILRMPTLFGWGHRMRFDTPVNGMVAQAVQDSAVRCGNDRAVRTLLHVGDAVTAIKAVLDSDVTRGKRVFNVGGHNTEVRDIVSVLKKANANLEIIEDEADTIPIIQTDGAKFLETFKIGPTATVEDGIKEMIQGILMSQGAVKWTDPIYHNHKV